MSSSVVQNTMTENVVIEESSTSVGYPEMVTAPEVNTDATEVPSTHTVVETSSVPMCEENPTQFERIRKQVQNTCKEVENDKIVKTIVTETGKCADAVGRVADRVGNELMGKKNVEQEPVGPVVTETVADSESQQVVNNPSEENTTHNVATTNVPTTNVPTTTQTQYVYVTQQNNTCSSIERDIVNGAQAIGRGLVNICDDILGSSRQPIIVVQPVTQPQPVAQQDVQEVAQPVAPVVMNQTPIVMQSTVGVSTSPNRQRPVARQIVAQ